MASSTQNDLYYTKDHEWVNFQGTIAFTGICSFKLMGFKAIEQVIYDEPLGFKKRGDMIASIRYSDYIIEAHMPVDGKLLEMNTNLIYGDDDLLLRDAEAVWIAKIAPSIPDERNDLLLPEQYELHWCRTLVQFFFNKL